MVHRDPQTGRFVSVGQQDIHPQWMEIAKVVESAAGTFTEGSGAPTGLSRRERFAMEILGVQWIANFAGLQGLTADLQAQLHAQLTSASQDSIILDQWNSVIIDQYKIEVAYVFTTSGATLALQEMTVFHDFASSGHGPLTVASKFFLSLVGNSSLTVLSAACRILHRFVRVTDEELLGLLAEQLGTND